MRIVGGRLRGRALAVPKGRELRPTADRVRESLFNVLAHGAGGVDLEGLTVIDVFAGTGALGLEAMSRGAGHGVGGADQRRAHPGGAPAATREEPGGVVPERGGEAPAIPLHRREPDRDMPLDNVKVSRAELLDALEGAGWVQAKAARLLGLTPRQIGYAIRKYDIEVRKF